MMPENANLLNVKRVGISAVGLLFAAVPISANAQAAETRSAEINEIGEIIVTATKRAGRLQDQPLAISALDATALSKTGKDTVESLLTSAPSFTMVASGPARQKVVLRGISAGGETDAQAAATGFYLDDVPISSSYTSSGTDLLMFDMARVEVLRGPQGTLYGGGSMGGTIKLVTNQPDLTEPSARMETGISRTTGSALGVELNAMANVPLVHDELALRLVGVLRHQQGYVRDIVTEDRAGGSEIKGIRGALRWMPNDALSLTAMALYQESEFTGVGSIDTDAAHRPVLGDLRHARFAPEIGKGTTRIFNMVGTYDLGWADLTSSTSYLHINSLLQQDSSLYLGSLLRAITAPVFGTPAALPVMPYFQTQPNAEKAFVQEVRLTSAGSGPFSWIIGGFYQHDDLAIHRLDYYAPGTYLGTVLGAINAAPIDLNTTTKRDLWAVFGEASYTFSPKLKLTAGLRYSNTRNRFVSTSFGLLLGRPTLASALLGDTTASQGHLSPKVTLSFTPDQRFMVYATVAEGFRPGGPNLILPPDPITGQTTPSTFNSDNLWNYEIGAKSSWLDNRLIANVSLFQMNLSGLQLVAVRGDQLPYIANAGSVRSKGLELEVSFRPIPTLSFDLAGAYTDDRFTANAAALFAKPGDRVPYVPKVAGSLSVDYRPALTDTLTGFINLGVSYNSGAPIGYNPNTRQPGVEARPYATVDARFGVTSASGLEVTLYAQNLTDKRGETFIDSIKFGPMTDRLAVTVLKPRTIGLKIGRSF